VELQITSKMPGPMALFHGGRILSRTSRFHLLSILAVVVLTALPTTATNDASYEGAYFTPGIQVRQATEI
jgi:hypothetical protein